MGRSPSDKTKFKEKRGTGHGADYKPWIKTSEFNSRGTCHEPVDWKHKRTIQLLSGAEEVYYYLLRWNDDVTDIREQYPLDLQQTVGIAYENSIRHPRSRDGNYTPMTTDFLIDIANEVFPIAVSIKYDRDRMTKRDIEKMYLAKTYWRRLGIAYYIYYYSDLSREDIHMAHNIARAVQYYDLSSVREGNNTDKAKYLVANKILDIDLTARDISFKKLGESIFHTREGNELWDKLLTNTKSLKNMSLKPGMLSCSPMTETSFG